MADGRVALHVLEGEDAVALDVLDERFDERHLVLAPGGADAVRRVLGGVRHRARLRVHEEEHAPVNAEVRAEFVHGRAEDLAGVERLADGARDAVDERLAGRLTRKLFGVAAARDELRGLPREGDHGKHALAVGRAPVPRVVERDEADELALVRHERHEEFVADVPGLGPFVVWLAPFEVGLEAVGEDLVEQG